MPAKPLVKTKTNLVGTWAFLIGIILAVIVGLFQDQIGDAASSYILIALMVIGIIVGIFNVTSSESNHFLLAGVSLVIVSFMGASVMGIITQVAGILNALLVLFIPATLIVALKTLFYSARN